MNNKKSLLLNSCAAIALLVILIFIYVPQSIYFAQREYFGDYFLMLITPNLIYGILVGFVVLIFFSILPGFILKYISSLTLLLALFFWIYVDFFPLNYGVLDGSSIDFERFSQRGKYELLVAGLLIILSFIFNKMINKHLPFLIFLLLVGLLSVSAYKTYKEPNDKELIGKIDEEFFKYSSEKNLILIVLDTFGSEYFQKIIDKDPEIVENYRGFVNYTDAISNYPATQGSAPSFLMGEMIPENVKYNDYLKKEVKLRGLPKLLSNNGYIVSVVSVYRWFLPFFPERFIYEPHVSQKALTDFYGSQLLDFSLFRTVPHFYKPKIYNNGSWVFSNTKAQAADIPNTFSERGLALMKMMTENAAIDLKNKTPRFKMIHVTIPHPHYRYDEDCKKRESNKGYIEDQLMLKQSECALKTLNDLLDKYKSMGIYDNSVIVVTSDHGARVFKDKHITGFPSYFEMSSSGILFMIKGINRVEKFKQIGTPFSLIKLKEALLNESLHESSYESLKDENRLFYAYWNNHKAAPGYLQDAPLYVVKKKFNDISSWHLKEFVINNCKKEKFPLNLTFKIVGREGYCSLYGFTDPEGQSEGVWTQSDDNRIILNVESSPADSSRTLKLKFLPHITDLQKSLNLEVFINGSLIGGANIDNKNEQELTFTFSERLILEDEVNVLQLKLPDVKSNFELGIDNDKRKLGLLMKSVQIY